MQSTPRSLKLRRRGRHAAPSQVEKIAGRATAAAPAAVIAGGVIIAGPTAASAATTHAVTASAPAAQAAHGAANHGAANHGAAKAGTTAKAATTDKTATLDAATSSAQSYNVQAGDTLSKISRHFYGTGSDWKYLYDQNTSTISNPNDIFPGQALDVPASAPSGAAQQSSAQAGTGTQTSAQAPASTTASSTATTSANASGGTLGCSGLENLWEEAGGSASEAHMAAQIAMAESGGNQYAVSPTDDYGYWQINASHGSEATFNPTGNAQAAISISGDGSDWSQWSTYTSGAYASEC